MDQIDQIIEENDKLKKKLHKVIEENTALSHINKVLKNNIFIDEITQLYNHNFLERRLEEEMKRAKRYTQFLSVVLISVDSLSREVQIKGFENTGDKLRQLGNFIKANMRDTDIISQFDQDILALILPETNIDGANALSERLREQILLAYSHINMNEQNQEKALSIGIAGYPTDARMKDELIKRGREMLERSKVSKENTICSSLDFP